MKLRRAMAVAAATAAIAPLALLSAPAAFADEETSTAATSSPAADETTPAADETSPAAEESSPAAEESSPAASESSPAAEESSPAADESSPAASPSTSDSASPSTSPSPSDDPGEACKDSKVDVSIKGLPGKIAAGSGWHKFTLNVANNSDSTLQDLDYFAGASSDKKGNDLFKSKQVELQAWDPQHKVWADLNEGGYAVGYVGYSDELKPDYEVDIPLRLNVRPSAPVGAGFSLGATVYGDGDGKCTGEGDVAYRFQIVSAGTDTSGTKPQEGGKAPVTDEKPSGDTPEVTGNLAETGSSSALPMIGLTGGLAVALGAGAVVVVRRRKAGVQA